jgi:hypothetical protein
MLHVEKAKVNCFFGRCVCVCVWGCWFFGFLLLFPMCIHCMSFLIFCFELVREMRHILILRMLNDGLFETCCM